MPKPVQRGALSTTELVAMVATLTALNALTIDIMLPALSAIDSTFSLANDNQRQWVVTAYVAPFGIAQLIYGPLADSFGRRSVLLYGLGLYILGAVLCVFAPSFELLLAARALQGVGAASTRVIATAVIRDTAEGRRMAQIMSLVMTVFMIIPIVAPGIGQLILFVAPWRWIFAALLVYAFAVTVWTWIRLPETLAAENRRAFNSAAILGGYGEVFRHRQTVGYLLATTLLSGGLFAFITAAEQIFVDVFHVGAAFALVFASVAVAMTIGTFVNARIVVRYGMRRVSHAMMFVFALCAAALAATALLGLHGFGIFLGLVLATFSVYGLVSSNLNALALEPVAHVAGSGAALLGSFTALFGSLIGAFIGAAFDGTTAPFSLGLAAIGLATLGAVAITERGRLFNDPRSDAPQSLRRPR